MPELITICSGRQFTPLERCRYRAMLARSFGYPWGLPVLKRSSSFSSMTSFVSFRHVENGKWSRSTP